MASSRDLLTLERMDTSVPECLLLEPTSRDKPIPLPPSSVLAKVRDFLPKMEQANRDLSQRAPTTVDIEHVEEGQAVIEMDLALGVAEAPEGVDVGVGDGEKVIELEPGQLPKAKEADKRKQKKRPLVEEQS